MKVLLVHQSAELYGSDRSFLSICKRLAEEGLEIDVLLPNYGPLVSELKKYNLNVMVHDFGVLRKSDLKKAPFSCFFKILLGFFYAINLMKRYELVYINTIVNLNFILACFFFRKKKFVHIREMPQGFIKKVFKFALYTSKANLIFNSRSVHRAFGLPGKVVYNGVNITNACDLNKKADSKTVLFVGRSNDWKGADLLLKSIKTIESFNLIDRVEIVGDCFDGQKHFVEELKKISSEISSVEVNFAGFVTDTSKFYANARVCVVPSKKPEPFGRVVVESMAHHLPVVVADHGGMAEIIQDKVNGFKFSPNCIDSLASTLVHVLKNDSISQKVSENAFLSYQENFTEKAYQEKVLNILLDGI